MRASSGSAPRPTRPSLAPSIVVASQVYHWEVVLDDIIDLVQGGTLGGEIYEINLENGGLVIEYNDAMPCRTMCKASADATIASIIAGDIATRPVGPTDTGGRGWSPATATLKRA